MLHFTNALWLFSYQFNHKAANMLLCANSYTDPSNMVRKSLIKVKNALGKVVQSLLHYYIHITTVNIKNMKSFRSRLSTTGLTSHGTKNTA